MSRDDMDQWPEEGVRYGVSRAKHFNVEAS